MSVLSITNQKGGVRKTTTTINLASALAEKGKEVLIIDLDPQGNATTSLGFNRGDQFISVYEVLMEGMDAKSAIFPTVQNRLSMLPANENLPGAEVELADRPERAYLLKKALGAVNSLYDYILIDCSNKTLGYSFFLSSLAKKVCHRHFGIGADGLILILD